MTGQDTMELLGQRIRTLVEKGDNMLASAAVCAAEARTRFDAGDTQGMPSWGAWWTKHTGLSDSRGRQLLLIGKAKDPAAAAEEHKEKNRQAVQRHRDGKGALLRNNAAVVTPSALDLAWRAYEALSNTDKAIFRSRL